MKQREKAQRKHNTKRETNKIAGSATYRKREKHMEKYRK